VFSVASVLEGVDQGLDEGDSSAGFVEFVGHAAPAETHVARFRGIRELSPETAAVDCDGEDARGSGAAICMLDDVSGELDERCLERHPVEFIDVRGRGEYGFEEIVHGVEVVRRGGEAK
jgi:hypothetical protein